MKKKQFGAGGVVVFGCGSGQYVTTIASGSVAAPVSLFYERWPCVS